VRSCAATAHLRCPIPSRRNTASCRPAELPPIPLPCCCRVPKEPKLDAEGNVIVEEAEVDEAPEPDNEMTLEVGSGRYVPLCHTIQLRIEGSKCVG
jgi:hypothetical protein